MAKQVGRLYLRGRTWYIDFPDPKTGKRMRRTVGTNRKHAERVLGNLRAARAARNAPKSKPSTEIAGDPYVRLCWGHYLKRIAKEGKLSSVGAIKTARQRWAKLEKLRVSQLTQATIDGIVDNLTCAVTSKNNSIKVLRACLRRAKRDKLLTNEIPVELCERKHVTPLPSTVSRQEFRALVENCSDWRGKTLLFLAMYAGLRHSEARFLTLSDLDFDNNLIHVTAKQGWSPKTWEDREVPFDPNGALVQVLKTHISLLPKRRPWQTEQGIPEWLFPNRRGTQPLSQPTTHRIISATFKKAAITGNRPGLHRLRRSWATNFLNKGGSLAALLRAGGWSELKTVQRYLGTDLDAARAAIEAFDY